MGHFYLGSPVPAIPPHNHTPPPTEPGVLALSPQPSSKLTLIITLALLALRAIE